MSRMTIIRVRRTLSETEIDMMVQVYDGVEPEDCTCKYTSETTPFYHTI